MKIRSHLTVMAIAILVPVAMASALAIGLLWKAQRADALHGLQESARAVQQNVDKEIGNATAALRVLARSANLAGGNLEGFYREAMAADMGEKAWVVLLNAEGHQIISTAVPFGTPTPPPVALAPVQRVMRSGEPFISNLFIGRRTGRFISTVNVPVPIDQGQRYVLVEAFEPAYFTRVFERSKLPPNWKISIVDSDGRFIARSVDGANQAGLRVAPELLTAMSGATAGDLRHRTRDGGEVYSSYVKSNLSGWTVEVAAPMTEIDGSARSAVLVAVIGLAAALALATGLAALLGRRLATSIATASRSAHALAAGIPFSVGPSGVLELDALHAAHREAAQVLVQAQHLRSAARAERESLIHAEQEARKRAEADLIAKDSFMAMLGHELRNPLNAMTGAIAVIDNPVAPPEIQRDARRILKRQNQQLAHIVDDLLDFNRMALGKIALNTIAIELCHATELCLESARSAGVRHRLRLDTASCPVWVMADPTRLEQMISNLLSNAVKFSDADSDIEVAVHRVDGQAALVVADHGIGMDTELLPRVFEPFVQGPAQLDRARGGLGIGLALVRQLVALHGGSVSASSEGVGQGSTVTLRLPLAPEADIPALQPVPCMAQSADAPTRKATVLLIEDNADSREMIRILLEMSGYVVLEAENGVLGLQLALRHAPDAAVIDVGLPDMDGYAVARAIRERTLADGEHKIRLIALTGYGQEDDRSRAMQAGFDLHLVKPLDIARLMAAIDGAADLPIPAS